MSREGTPPYDEGMGSERISERLTDAQERIAGIGSKIKDKAAQIGSTVSQTVDKQREVAARSLDRAALGLHGGAGSAADMAHGLADGMTTSASYLRSHSFGEMGNDIAEVCRRHPAQALISAAVLGFVVARAIRR